MCDKTPENLRGPEFFRVEDCSTEERILSRGMLHDSRSVHPQAYGAKVTFPLKILFSRDPFLIPILSPDALFLFSAPDPYVTRAFDHLQAQITKWFDSDLLYLLDLLEMNDSMQGKNDFWLVCFVGCLWLEAGCNSRTDSWTKASSRCPLTLLRSFSLPSRCCSCEQNKFVSILFQICNHCQSLQSH